MQKKINQDLPKYIYYRESHGGKYKGYVVEHPKGTKRFSKKNLHSGRKFNKMLKYI